MNDKIKEIIKAHVILALYDVLSKTISTKYDSTDKENVVVMVNGATLELKEETTYPFQYHHVDDIGWIQEFGKCVARWFYKSEEVYSWHVGYVCIKVGMDDTNTIAIKWGKL